MDSGERPCWHIFKSEKSCAYQKLRDFSGHPLQRESTLYNYKCTSSRVNMESISQSR